MNAWLDEDQRSVAIGKKGQNISLASELSGFKINLIAAEKTGVSREKDLGDISGLEPEKD